MEKSEYAGGNAALRAMMATRGAGPRRCDKAHAIRKLSGYTVSLRHARGGPRADREWRGHATAPPKAGKPREGSCKIQVSKHPRKEEHNHITRWDKEVLP